MPVLAEYWRAQRSLWRDHRSLPLALVGALATVNVHASRIAGTVAADGWPTAAMGLFGVSAITWCAIVAMLLIAHEDGPMPPEPLSLADGVTMASALLLILFPWHAASLLALLLLGGWTYWRSPTGSRARRIAVIMLALGGSIAIGRLLLNSVGSTIVNIDAHFVAWLAGVPVRGNVVDFAAEQGGTFIVGVSCSSVQNMSLATVLWATAVQLFDLRTDWRLITTCIAAMAGLFLVNAARLTTIAWYPRHFDTIHNGDVAAMFGFAGLVVAAVIVGIGIWRAPRPAV